MTRILLKLLDISLKLLSLEVVDRSTYCLVLPILTSGVSVRDIRQVIAEAHNAMQTKRANALSNSELRGLWLRLCTCLILALSIGIAPALAIQNPPRSTVASGGTVSAQSATHRVSGTVGQIASGRPQSTTNTVEEGFWNSLQICDCPHVGDLDTNSVIDILDVIAMVNSAFRGAPTPAGDPFCPTATRADVNCDTLVDILDVIALVNTAFRNIESRCSPCEQ